MCSRQTMDPLPQGTSWRAPSATSPGNHPSRHIKPSHVVLRWRKHRGRLGNPVLLLPLIFLSVVNGARAQFLQITAPQAIVQCTPTTVSWTGGTAPYFLSIINVPGSTPSGLPSFSLEFNNLNITTFTWNTGFSAGTPVVFLINDHDGTSSDHTNATVILPGMIDTCLPQVNTNWTARYYTGSGTTSSSLPTYSANTDSPGPNGLNKADIAGVALGSIIAAVILAVLGFCLLAGRRSSSTDIRAGG